MCIRDSYNPLAEGYEIADRFIAGNVVQKVADVEGWIRAVSYTHLDVYKRQPTNNAVPRFIPIKDKSINE